MSTKIKENKIDLIEALCILFTKEEMYIYGY